MKKRTCKGVKTEKEKYIMQKKILLAPGRVNAKWLQIFLIGMVLNIFMIKSRGWVLE